MLILKLQKLKRKEKVAQTIITDFISFEKLVVKYEKKAKTDYKDINEFTGVKVAFEILGILDNTETDDLLGELLDLLNDTMQKHYRKKPKKIMLIFWDLMIPYAQKYMKAEKIYKND